MLHRFTAIAGEKKIANIMKWNVGSELLFSLSARPNHHLGRCTLLSFGLLCCRKETQGRAK